MGETAVDVAVVGAGPYGLGLAAHLSAAGVRHRIFGHPMSAWSSMSPGMFLKSFAHATNIRVPQAHRTLPEYCRERNLEDYEPVPIAVFAEYGKWVQEALVPNVEPLDVTHIRKLDDGFVVTTEGGERVHARRVVVAIGLSYFAHMPGFLSTLPAELASHTATHGDFSCFRGQDVTVVGAGQSALQAAALLHENGATVRILARGDVSWNVQTPRDVRRPFRERLRYPNSIVGPGRKNWVMEHAPTLVHYLPAERRRTLVETHLGPTGAWWLRDRVEGVVPVETGVSIVKAVPEREGLNIRTDGSGGERGFHTDHVIAGTGYRVDVGRIGFLDEQLVPAIAHRGGSPVLSRHFESTVDGLYFIGPSSAGSFGPLFRFVAGSYYTVPVLARHLTAKSVARTSLWPGRTRQVREV